MSRPTCETCPFWTDYDPETDSGECRRFPPLDSFRRFDVDDDDELTLMQAQYESAGVNTDSVYWCGEHPDMAEWIKKRPAE